MANESEIERDMREVRIKYFGQCPNYKGHDESTSIVSFFAGCAITSVIAVVLMSIIFSSWSNWAIKVGAASYDPYSGYLIYKK